MGGFAEFFAEYVRKWWFSSTEQVKAHILSNISEIDKIRIMEFHQHPSTILFDDPHTQTTPPPLISPHINQIRK